MEQLNLARQEKIWAREGVELSRATLANWVIQCSQIWQAPVQTHEAVASGGDSHSCGRDSGTGIESGWKDCCFRIQNVALCQW